MASEKPSTVIWPDRSGLSRQPGDLRPSKRKVTLRPFTFIRDWEVSSPVVSPQPRSISTIPRDGYLSSDQNDVSQRSDSDYSMQSSQSSRFIRPSPVPVVLARSQSPVRSPRFRSSDSTLSSGQNLTESRDNSVRRSPRLTSSVDPSRSGQLLTESRDNSVRRSPRLNSVNTPGSGQLLTDDHDNSVRRSPRLNSVNTPESDQLVTDDHDSLESSAVTPSQLSRVSSQHSPVLEVPEEQNLSSGGTSAKSTRPASTQKSKRVVSSKKQNHSQVSNASNKKTPAVSAKRGQRFKTPASVQQKVSEPDDSYQVVNTTMPAPRSKAVVRVKRRREPPPSPSQQDDTLPTEPGYVKMWSGSGRKRTMIDLTDLDVILDMVENVTLDYRENIDSGACKRAINEFFLQFRKAVTDYIDLSQEFKLLRSAVSRNTSRTRNLRKTIFHFRQENIRLDGEKAEKKQRLDKSYTHRKAMEEISEFSTDLQYLLQDFADTTKDTDTHDYNCAANLPAMMQDIGNTMNTVTSLRSINDNLQQWLDNH
ncbi:uncharacterized protein LOC144452455 [Glandiceps talaboti]